jgi:hypothetical protein
MSKIQVIVDNVYTKVENASKETEFTIWNDLSFQVEEFGSEHVKIRHLFNRKTKKTYTGLMDYVIKILDNIGEEYDLIDTREKHEPNANFKIVDFVDEAKTIPFTWRPYQREIIDRATERECLQAATGAGKTAMMAGLIEKFNVKPVAIFADKLSLCTQIKEEFEKFLGIPIGIVGGGMNQKEDITVYSIQSATVDDVKDAKMIMFDECLAYAEKVLMEDGTHEEIGKLFDNKTNKKVMSFNHKTGKIEAKGIISFTRTLLKKNNKKMMKLTIRKADGTKEIIECTDNHKIWIESLGQYVMAKDLVKGQTVKTLRSE